MALNLLKRKFWVTFSFFDSEITLLSINYNGSLRFFPLLLLMILSIICLIPFLFEDSKLMNATASEFTRNQSGANQNLTAISVSTDRAKYVTGQPITIFGTVSYNSQLRDTKVNVLIESIGGIYDPETQTYSDLTVFRTSVLSRNGYYNVTFNPAEETLLYNATVTALIDGNPETAWILVNVQELFLTKPFIILYVLGGGGFAALVLIIIKRERIVGRLRATMAALIGRPVNGDKERQLNEQQSKLRQMGELQSAYTQEMLISKEKEFELARFMCLSAIAMAPIAAFVFTDVEISPNSPIGLILKPTVSPDTENGPQLESSWMINIGGDALSNYESGIQVPVDIVIFGIAGGYLRYLWQTAEKVKEIGGRRMLAVKGEGEKESAALPTTANNPNEGSATKTEHKSEVQVPHALREAPETFYEALRDIALFFLAPLLAIAVWLVLLQGGTTSIYTLAAISFAVGLVTREVIEAIISFAGRVLGGLKQT
jgi:hypothetical protein